MTDHLERIRERVQARALKQEEVRQAIIEARATHTLGAIGQAAGLSRQRIHQITKEGT